MRRKDYKRESYFYADDGREIAMVMDDKNKDGSVSQVLYFNSDRLAVRCFQPESKTMTFPERAKPQYRNDFEELLRMFPEAKTSEYSNL